MTQMANSQAEKKLKKKKNDDDSVRANGSLTNFHHADVLDMIALLYH